MASIRFQVSASFLLFLLLTIMLAVFSIRELAAVNRISTEIRGRWLQSVRLLGDLNNYSSDYRAAEAGRILAAEPTQAVRADADLAQLTRKVSAAQAGFAAGPHDPREEALYARFDADWRAYLQLAEAVTAQARRGELAQARTTWLARSGPAYDRASDALGSLTDLTVSRAEAASRRAEARYRSARWVLAGAIAAACLMAIAAFAHVTAAVSNPLRVLAARMRALARNDTGVDIPGQGRNDEIGEMARAMRIFRANAIELSRVQEDLRRQATLLERSLEQERKLATLQRDFVAMASHEFRTPLNVIDGHAQRLARHDGRLATGEAGERAGSIRRAVRRITEVIDSLLAAPAMLDDGAIVRARAGPFDPAELLAEAAALQREGAPRARILEDLEAAPRWMVADRALLFQAVANLLANAIKYSPPETPVRLRAWGEAGSLLVSVADEGRGIPAMDLERVFERYRRGANAADVAGAGVGLYLVRSVAELHGGAVSVKSREGEGSSFTLRIPLAPRLGPKALESAEG